MSKTYCGYISIIGKPNVGKSTILNHILGKKISITSRKSQTTRNNILGIKTVENKQMIFADTPGMHIKSPKVMNKVLNRSAQSLIDDSDIILFVVQRLTLDEQDLSVLEKLKEAGSQVICVVNKVDQITDKNKLLPMMARLAEEYSFLDIIPISAINNEGISDLEVLIQKYLPENQHIYGEESLKSNHKDLFMISELIREKIIRMLGDELPHDTFVQVELLEDEEKIIKIHAVIYVVRESQKQIVIGKGGGTLKKIGQQARIELEEYFSKKVFLKTWVKVKKNWNTDSDYIQSLGVGGSYES
jgi:GTP-binding protein Era|tara:strand:+ start:1371 stop:2276 length:906 start_codon:yes stop_codon:yes gene_type:complete